MKVFLYSSFLLASLFSCKPEQKQEQQAIAPSLKDSLIGSWELIDAVQIKKDSVISTKTAGHKMVKIINPSHFAFLQHAVEKVKDSSFVAGGGRYDLKGDQYTEHLEYCNFTSFEGHDFTFRLQIKGDTLIQSGEEKRKDLGIGDENIQLRETYLRVKQ